MMTKSKMDSAITSMSKIYHDSLKAKSTDNLST